MFARLASLRGRARRLRPGWTRNNYKGVWNDIAASPDGAADAVAGYADEQRHRQAAEATLAMLQRLVGVRDDDTVLEIGAGVGRVGDVLAPLCREWVGADVSEKMVAHMRRRLAHHANARAVAISGYDLDGIPSNSFDLVYCTVVFMHLEEWDRFGYVKEGLRVLKPGGRMLVDNVNLMSDEGWAFFEQHASIPPLRRPPYISKTSTPQEIGAYFERAGFAAIRQEEAGGWTITYGSRQP